MFAYVGCYTTPDRDGRGKGIEVYEMDPESGAWTHVQTLETIGNPSWQTVGPERSASLQRPRRRRLHAGQRLQHRPVQREAHLPERPGVRQPQPRRDLDLADRAVRRRRRVQRRQGRGAAGQRGRLARPDVRPRHPRRASPARTPPSRITRARTTSRSPRTASSSSSRTRGSTGPTSSGWTRRTARSCRPSRRPSSRRRAPRRATSRSTRVPRTPTSATRSTRRSPRSATTPRTGRLDQLEVQTTLPEGFSERNSTAEIHVAPSGRFVYVSNRGHNSIADLQRRPGDAAS